MILEKSLERGGTPHRTSRFCKDELGLSFRYKGNIGTFNVILFSQSYHWA